MDAKTLSVFFLVLTPVVIAAWQSQDRRSPRDLRQDIHYHSKRHMLPRETDRKRRTTTARLKDIRKKPSGHLRPIQEDEMENDEVVSVAIGPPAIRPKYDKIYKNQHKLTNHTTTNNTSATKLVKDVLFQLGQEFLTHQLNEDFVFGQYVGNCMKNLTQDLRLKMQHEILEIIVKYQRMSHGEVPKLGQSTASSSQPEDKNILNTKDIKVDKKLTNETEESWPDFTNLAKIVG